MAEHEPASPAIEQHLAYLWQLVMSCREHREIHRCSEVYACPGEQVATWIQDNPNGVAAILCAAVAELEATGYGRLNHEDRWAPTAKAAELIDGAGLSEAGLDG